MKLNLRQVRILMAQKGIDTGRDFAALLGITEASMYAILSGRFNPRLDNVGKLCSVLGCTPNDILVVEREPEAA